MSNNCLVTKLKGEVNNDNLPLFGLIRFIKVIDGIPTDWPYDLQVGSNSDLLLKSTNTSYFTLSSITSTDTQEVLLPYTVKQWRNDGTIGIHPNTVGDDILIGKYDKNISHIKVHQGFVDLQGSLEDFKYLTGLTSLSLNNTNVTGNIESLKDLIGLTSLNLNNTNVTGNIESLKDLIGLTSLSLNSNYRKLITGNYVKALGHNTNIQNVLFNGSSVTGDVVDFVKAQIAAGKTSVPFSDTPLYISGILGNERTFKGNSYNDNTYGYVAWESEDRIVVYTGGIFSDDSYIRVTVLGATNDEISAWQAAGKTVRVVS